MTGTKVGGREKGVLENLHPFSIQDAECFGERINLCGLRKNQFVHHPTFGEFCCIFNSLTWVVPIKQNFILFSCAPDGRKCKQLSKW